MRTATICVCFGLAWAAATLAQSPTTPTAVGVRVKAPDVLSWQLLPSLLPIAASKLGKRMQEQGKERMTLNGTLTDSQGTRPVQISLQLPGKARIDDSTQKRVITVDETGLKGLPAAAAAEVEGLYESLAVCSVENIFDAVVFKSAAIRSLGDGFRLEGWQGLPAAISTVDLYNVVLPAKSRGNGLDRSLKLILAVDSATRLPVLVRRAAGEGKQASETRFLAWQKVGNEQIASEVVRMEGSREVFRFRLVQSEVGGKAPDAQYRQ